MVAIDLPCHEAHCLNNRGLNNFLAGEHAPGDGIRAIGVRVSAQIPAFVDYIVRDAAIALDVGKEKGEQGRADEEFEIRLFPRVSANIPPYFVLSGPAYLLIDIPIARSPPKRLVVASCSINGGLRINGQKPEFVDLGEGFCNDGGLAGRKLV